MFVKPMNDFSLEIKNLSAGYKKSLVINDFSLTVSSGQIVSLVGSNGSGKSTLLKSISGQIPLLSGDIFINKKNLADFNEAARAKVISLLLSERIRPENMTAFELAAMGRYPHTGRFGFLTENDKKIVEKNLSDLDCLSFKERLFSELSDGQKQRVLIARALCQEPDILLLDEPTAFLDLKYKLKLLTLLQKKVEEGMAVIMAIHEIELARSVSTKMVCMSAEGIKIAEPRQVDSAFIRDLYGITEADFENLSDQCKELI